MKVDTRMAYVRAQPGRLLWRINEIDIGNLNRRNLDGGNMKIDMRMAEHYSLRKTIKKHMGD
jgi:hypothetical protein